VDILWTYLISPHVTIYSQPLPAITSITNRTTGIITTGYITIAAMIALTGSCDVASGISSFCLSYPSLVPLTRMLISFPFIYHTYAGLRHLIWDYTAKGMDLQSVELSSKILIGAAITTAIGVGFITI